MKIFPKIMILKFAQTLVKLYYKTVLFTGTDNRAKDIQSILLNLSDDLFGAGEISMNSFLGKMLPHREHLLPSI